MPTTAPPNAFFGAFAEYVHAHRDAIGKQWMQDVRMSPNIPKAIDLSLEALQDHVPQLLEALVDQLRDETAAQQAAADHSRSHGTEQWSAGYNFSELIWEIYIIRRVLVEVALPEFCRKYGGFAAEDIDRAAKFVQEFFHRVTCESVTQFATENERRLTEMNEALRAARDARERLSRTVSHELRNIVHSLSLSVNLLSGADSEEERRETASISAKMLSDMTLILNELLEYSEVLARGRGLTSARVALSELGEEIATQWRPAAEEQKLRFEYSCEANAGDVMTDKLKVKQIAGNLISNAIKYRKPASGGFVGVSLRKENAREWKMVVADTGIGLAAQDLKDLFGVFHRVQPQPGVEGSGLGLSLCKEFAELLGGHLTVRSELGEGTRFELTLPVGEVRAAPSQFLENAGQPPFTVL
jgi:signal transduction histidine kinase